MEVKSNLYPLLQQFVKQAQDQFNNISQPRKDLLKQLADYVAVQQSHGQKTSLNFICTHNSRRSHIAQIWAQCLAAYYGVRQVQTYSGGTEATAFNPRAVAALQELGFKINVVQDGKNPVYEVRFSDVASLKAYSKVYDAEENPTENFCAIMTCSHADENCPFIIGASKRIALTYDDPKDFDGTPLEKMKYAERVNEIGRDLAYAFSLIKTES